MKFTLRHHVILWSVVFGLWSSVFANPDPVITPPDIRVSIASGAPEVSLSVKGPYRISIVESQKLVDEGKKLSWRKVRATPAGMTVGPEIIHGPGVRIEATREGSIYLNGKRFRGAVEMLAESNAFLRVINHLNIEDYVAGVLYQEISPWWPFEVVKAQAIAARTYALYTKQEQAVKAFHLTSDFYSQVYGGASTEKKRARLAVEATRGQILTYNGKLFPTYFHATCGGETEDAGVLWKVNVPPLKGVTCSFCTRSPHFRWEQRLPLAEIQRRVELYAQEIGPIESIEILERTPRGRIAKLKIAGMGGEVTVSGKDFRQWMDPRVIRSTAFTVAMIADEPNVAVIRGNGWGHGVGMCQWGAYFQAKEGKRAEEILAFYYPGATIASNYGTR